MREEMVIGGNSINCVSIDGSTPIFDGFKNCLFMSWLSLFLSS